MHPPRRSAPTVSPVRLAVPDWRGLPLIPSNKVPLEDGKTKILLLRRGDKRRGVVGLTSRVSPASRARPLGPLHGHQPAGDRLPTWSAFLPLVVQSPDALAVPEDVEVGKFHDHPDTYK